MRFGFVTCVQLGLSCMEAIYEAGGELSLAITLPDEKARSKSGRVYISEFCEENNVDLIKSPNVNDDLVINAIRSHSIDWLFIIGWSQIAKPALLAAPRLGTLGMHPSLLPVGRGRAAIPWAILKQLDKTGVTLFKLSEGVDTGDIIDQKAIPLSATTDASQLYEEVQRAHVTLMRSALPKLSGGSLAARPQDETRATYWPGRTAAEGAIDLSGSVHDAERLVRAVTRPYPGAFFFADQQKVTVWRSRLCSRHGACPDARHLRFNDGILHFEDWEAGPADPS